MSYYRMLEEQKKARNKFEREQEILKEQLSLCSSLYTQYDGDYLEKLKEFNSNYQKNNTKSN